MKLFRGRVNWNLCAYCSSTKFIDFTSGIVISWRILNNEESFPLNSLAASLYPSDLIGNRLLEEILES